MKKEKVYFIEIISTATAENKNFAGDIHRYVYGKRQELVAFNMVKNVSGDTCHLREFDITDVNFFATEYGFKSAKMAETVGKRLHAADDTYNGVTNWTNKLNIIEREVRIEG